MRFHVLVSLLAGLAAAQDKPVWETLPPTPQLPGSPAGSYATVNGVNLWFAEFDRAKAGKPPVFLLHGGFGNSDYWGDVVAILMQNGHHVLVMDTRAQGRSTSNGTPLTYPLLGRDAAGLLATLGYPQAYWVGWSDMGTATYAALMDAELAPFVAGAFVFGGTHAANATDPTFADSGMYNLFATRAAREFHALQPDSDVMVAAQAVEALEANQPTWTQADLAKIQLGRNLTVAAAQYDEAVVHTEPALLHSWIAGSQLVTLTNVSHFAPIQDPKQFAAAIETFLAS